MSLLGCSLYCCIQLQMAFCTPQSFQRRRIGFDAVMLVIFKCVNKKKSGKISMISLSGNVMYIYFVY